MSKKRSLKPFTFTKVNGTRVLLKNIIEDNEITETIDISNFKSVIEEQITYINFKGDKKVKLKIITTDKNRTDYEPVVIDAVDLESLKWVPDNYGIKVSLTEGRKSRELFLEAIKYLSRHCKETTTFEHSGYIKLHGKYVYLSGRKTIDSDGVVKKISSNLPATLKHYGLPAPAKILANKIENAKSSLTLLDISNRNPQLGAFLLSLIARTPLSIVERVDFSCFIVGITGTKKSSIAGLALNFFGRNFNYDNLPAHWISTDNTLERLTQLVQDTLLVVDDFKYKSASSVNLMNDLADRIFRGIANGAIRLRLTEVSSAKLPKPKSMLLSTGEVVPFGAGIDQSMHDRVCYLSLMNGDVDVDTIIHYQQLNENGCFSKNTSTYIQYILKHTKQVGALYKKEFAKTREYIKEETNIATDRVINNFSSLIAALKVYFNFMIKQGAISKKESTQLFINSRRLLTQLALDQHDIISKANILNAINHALEKSLIEGDCILRDIKTNKVVIFHQSTGNTKASQPKKIVTAGWIDSKSGEIYINRKFNISQILKYAPGSTKSLLSLPKNSFWKFMRASDCLLDRDDARDRNNIRKTIGGKPRIVYHTRFKIKTSTKTTKTSNRTN